MQLISGGARVVRLSHCSGRAAVAVARRLWPSSIHRRRSFSPLSYPQHPQSTGSSSLFAHLHGQPELAAPLICPVSPEVSAAFSLAALVVHSLHHHAYPSRAAPRPPSGLYAHLAPSRFEGVVDHPLQGMGRRQPIPSRQARRLLSLSSVVPALPLTDPRHDRVPSNRFRASAPSPRQKDTPTRRLAEPWSRCGSPSASNWDVWCCWPR